MESKKFTLNQNDWVSIGKGALVATGGALLTYVADVVIPGLDIGDWTPVLVSTLSVAVNVCRKWLAGVK